MITAIKNDPSAILASTLEFLYFIGVLNLAWNYTSRLMGEKENVRNKHAPIKAYMINWGLNHTVESLRDSQ